MRNENLANTGSLSFFTDYYLGKQQNAITNTGLDGEVTEVPVRAEDRTAGAGGGSMWQKLKNAYYREH